MRRGLFVGTSSVVRAQDAVEKCIAGKKISLICGPPGTGKSSFAKELVARHNAVIVRARAHWTLKTALGEIIYALGGWHVDLHTVGALYERLVSDFAAVPGILIIDEADYLIEPRTIGLLHALRDFFDETGCVVVFISIALLARKLNAPGDGLVEAVASRLGPIARFERASLADAQLLANELVEGVRFEGELVAHCLKRANGSIRSLIGSYEEIEKLARIAGGEKLDLAGWQKLQAMAGAAAQKASPAAALRAVK